MGKNTKQAFQLALIVLAFASLVAWCITVGRADVIWGLRIGSPLATVGVAWWFFKAGRRPENLPDHLRAVAPNYFERDGLCLMPVLETAGGLCRMSLYFQNRYAGHAAAQVEVWPPKRNLWFGRHPLPTVSVEVQCPGGAFGVFRLPFPIPAKYQGRRMQFDLGADVKYRPGRGKMLRFRCGRRLASIGELTPRMSIGLAGALIAISRISRVRLALPRGVAETAPPESVPPPEILWAPELPTGGFPVLPASRAA